MGLSDDSSSISVVKILEGYRRSRSSQDSRLPITLDILHSISLHLDTVCVSSYETVLFHAAFTLAFFGLFRVGELVLSDSNYQRPLQLSDIRTFEHGQSFQVKLRQSKTNQCGVPQIINIPRIDLSTCPVAAMHAYIKIRPVRQGHNLLFCHRDGSPLTRYQFGAVLSKVISKLQLNTACYKTHSFRIGAATWLARKGVSHDAIKALGRWSSDAFRRYIR